MASVSTCLPATLAGASEYNNDSYSSDFRTQPDAPAALYSSLSLLPPNLYSILSQPSQLDLLQDLILRRLSQLAEQIERHRSSSPPTSEQVLASRETSSSSELATTAPKAAPQSELTPDYSYIIHTMPRKSSSSSIRQPAEAFHMRTRRNQRLQASSTTSQPNTLASSPDSATSPPTVTPDLTVASSTNSSPLSSPPFSEDESSPASSATKPSSRSGTTSNMQPPKPSKVITGKRQKVSDDAGDDEVVMMDQSYYARRPSLEDEFKQIAQAATDFGTSSRRSRRSGTTPKAGSETPQPASSLSGNDSSDAGKRKASSGVTSNLSEDMSTPAKKVVKPTTDTYDRSRYPKGPQTRDMKKRAKFILALLKHEDRELSTTQSSTEAATNQHASNNSRPEFQKVGKIYVAADGETRYRPESESKGSPARSNRGGGRGGRGRGGARGGLNRGGGNGNGNGNGGRGRPRGKKNAGDDDSEPPRKLQLTEEEDAQIKQLKLRQQELKRFFNTVGSYQTELLEQMVGKDLNKLVKKARAHAKVPEYDELVDDLRVMMESGQQVARKKFEVAKAAEMNRYEQEKEVIEAQYRRRCEDTRLEHLQGTQGDIISLKKAHAAAIDETRTEAGSEVDYFPRYHELPEADTHVRGYTSMKITDEKPFKEYLESYGELDLQDVINEDITGPMIESIQKENAKHAKEQRLRQSRTMTALLGEVAKRVDDIKDSHDPQLTRQSEPDAYKLSFLADVAEYRAKEPPQQQYTYMPLGPGEHFSQHAPPFGSHPVQGNGRPLAPAPVQLPTMPQIPVTTVPPTRRSRNKSKASMSSISSISSIPPLRPSLSLQTQYQANGGPTYGPPSTSTSIAPSPVVSTGPGQVIAPAPPKHGLHPYSLPSAQMMQPTQAHFRRPSEPASQRFMGYPASTGAMPVSSMLQNHTQLFGPPLPSQQQQQMQHPAHQLSGPASAPVSLPPPPSPRTMPSPSTTRPSGPVSAGGSSSNSTSAHPFIFQQPAGVLPSSPRPGTTRYGPQSPSLSAGVPLSGGGSGGTQGKIPVTFVNQTIASRNAAAVAKANRKNASAGGADCGSESGSDAKMKIGGDGRRGSGNGGPLGGVRMLLPKH